MRIAITLLIGFLATGATAQVIRGYVYENETSLPIREADVFIIGEQSTVQIQSGEDGRFVYTPESTGRFDVIVSHLNFELIHLPAMQLSGAKDLILDIPMTRRIRELTEVNILAPSVRRIQNRFYTVTEEETRRLPGTFFDPARAASLFPGVSIDNDQANGLVIHGLSPLLMQWQLEGVSILNPNHLTNAGTLSDRASATGGGVNMISNQVLATSSLVSGALPTRYGDAVAGVMDMQFRQGNPLKNEHTVQAGLLGLEVASEGPFSAGSKASYLVNYRYSFVGLLTGLGIDFGGEKISFQDINFNMHFPLSVSGSYVKIFGVAGVNKTDLIGPKLPEEREDSRDISMVDYGAGGITTGGALQWPTRKGVIKAAVALSYTGSSRDEDRLDELDVLSFYSGEELDQTQISSRLEWQSPRSNRITLNAGVGLKYQWINGTGDYPQSQYITGGNASLVRPYGQVSYVLTGDIVIRGGIGLSSLSGKRRDQEVRSSQFIPEPSLHVYWQAGEKFSIESGYSYSGMTTPRITYQYSALLDPDFLRAHTFSFIFRNQIKSGTQLAGIMHYYGLSHVPGLADSMSSQTILGDSGFPHAERYSQDSKGRAISLALALRQDVLRGKFIRAGIGWIHSTHQGASGILLSTAYDSGPWAFFAGGKEWTSERVFGSRVIGVNGAVHWRGGMRDQFIDIEDSRDAGYTVYVDEGDFSVSLMDYFRMDLRVYLRKDKSNKTTTWSLDIQNLSSRENAYLSMYDPFQDAVRQTKQLGIVPVLSYRVDF